MFPAKAFLSLILLSIVCVDATRMSHRRGTGKATLRIATMISATGPRSIIEKDQARAKAMQQAGKSLNGEISKRDSTPFDVANTGVAYTTEIGIGSPATKYTVLIDTGSANTWIGAKQAYTQTSTSVDTGHTFSRPYGPGNITGEEWLDTVTLAPGLSITKQSIGVANSSSNFASEEGVDGILGLGPVDLSQGTVSDTSDVSTVTHNLYAQGTIQKESLGVYFVPFSATNSTGTLTFGGVDTAAITSSVSYVPLTSTQPAADYWGIEQSISYGGSTILKSTAGIVNTANTLILIASDALAEYQSLTGATKDSTTGFLTITKAQYAKLKNLTFHIGDKQYDLTPNGQIWPRSLNTVIGGKADAVYLVINDIGWQSGAGLDFINGYVFLERFYSVFDRTNSQVGFATTAYTTAEVN